MGCDWYDFSAVTGKGKVYLSDDPGPATNQRLVFNAKHCARDERDGSWCVGLVDDEKEETTKWLVIEFQGATMKSGLYVPGPYEITSEYRYVVVQVKGDTVLVTSTMNLSYPH